MAVSGGERLLCVSAVGSTTVVSVISLIVATVGVAFGIYQWSRQRGHVRVEIDGGQADLYLRVVVDTPTPVYVSGIAYCVKARGRWRRLAQSLDPSSYSGHASVHRRLKAMWRFRDFDMAMGWLTRTAPWDWDVAAIENGSIEPAFIPVAGPEIPMMIDGYRNASWRLHGANFTPILEEIARQCGVRNPKLRFRVDISGHPRRHVHSSWTSFPDISIMAPENQHWIQGERGLPQS